MEREGLVTAYRLLGELLLHPDDREAGRVEDAVRRCGEASWPGVEAIRAFLADPRSRSRDEYVQTLELSPPCPLYLGAYLFDEPTTCRGVGTSGRNRYMLELGGVYRHFGFELTGRELPDYLPVVVDFLWISLCHGDRDRIGLRRRLLERFVRPALAPLHAALARYDSPYALLIEALEQTVDQDLLLMDGVAAWRPPAPRLQATGRGLPILPVLEPAGRGAREAGP